VLVSDGLLMASVTALLNRPLTAPILSIMKHSNAEFLFIPSLCTGKRGEPLPQTRGKTPLIF
jgi:hypothetical protein